MSLEYPVTNGVAENGAVNKAALGIVFAVPIEADAFARRASGVTELEAGGLVFREGRVAGRGVAWCVAGVGREAAARAARRLILGHRPRLVVSAGFAGGLAPDLVRGSLIRAARVTLPDRSQELRLAHAVVTNGRDLTLVTADRIVTTPAEKADLRAASGADTVDMETFAVAEVAAAEGLPCGSLRVISDGAGQTLPREVAMLARPQSAMRRLGAAVGAIGRRPRAATDLWRLWEHAVVDGRTLAAALADLCGSLPESESVTP
jgi:adenosylhomocysteine nucleosidase